jgi:hypothetical protein
LFFKTTNKNSDVNAGQKLQMIKHAALKNDISTSKLRVVNLSVGEAFGFEECQGAKPKER